MPAGQSKSHLKDCGGDVFRAIEWLRHCRRQSTEAAEAAIEYLDRLRSSTSILNLYRRMFPALFRASTASMFSSDSRWSEHTAREGEFLRLISRRFFPIPGDDRIDFFDEQQRFETIPVTPLQGDSWCCSEFELDQLRSCYFISFGLFAAGEYWPYVVERYSLTESDPRPTENVDYNRLRAILKEERTPLKHLVLAVEMIHYETGNIWLDYSFCQPALSLDWTVENVRSLAGEYRKAEAAFDQIEELDRYLDAHPQEAVRQAVRLWNQAARVQEPEQQSG
jgi:hypothetical protein